MVRVNGRRSFTKATHAESARKGEPVGAAKRSRTELSTERIIEKDASQLAPNSAEFHRLKEPTYAEGRCRFINPNAYCAPFNRTQTPREARNRRPAGWTAIYITLPKITVEGLQKVAITLGQEGQHSPWPRERRRYPRTKSHLIGEALDDFFRKVGFAEFCLQESNTGENDRTGR